MIRLSSYFVFFFVLNLFRIQTFSLGQTLSENESLSVSSNRTITSPNSIFELGFFEVVSKKGDGKRWYLAIWYKDNSRNNSDLVWIANRNSPLKNSNGEVKISESNLVVLDQDGHHFWSSNVTIPSPQSPVVAELLDNGNFVLRYSNNSDPDAFLWQSFDFPTDTLLPEMKLGVDKRSGLDRYLTSWKSEDDPSSGDFTYRVDTNGWPQRFLFERNSEIVHRSDMWNRVGSRGKGFIKFNLTVTNKVVSYSITDDVNESHRSLRLEYTGQLRLIWWPPSIRGDWDESSTAPADSCDEYSTCGPYTNCNSDEVVACKCIEGFMQRNRTAWEYGETYIGCERIMRLRCHGDDFVKLSKIKWPDTREAIWNMSIGLEECRLRCLDDCNCTAYASMDPHNDSSGLGCLIWRTALVDIRTFTVNDLQLYVRIAREKGGEGKGNLIKKIIGSIAAGCFLLFLCFFIFWFLKRKRKRATERNKYLQMNEVRNRRDLSGQNEDLALPRLDFSTVVKATQNFSSQNKLGEGGFGVVYKGRLLDGNVIAVKRLSQMSEKGTNQFTNEAKVIAKVQHINLVRLLGYCVDKEEHILIYEFLENGSLDAHLFDNTKSCKLNWQTRFAITCGIARGLQYLHEDSQFRVIHRDMKASNILLDKDMMAKIADFGMARIIGREETQHKTRTVVGTFGYMSPEYTHDGIFSVKSDVFSFGVLVIEILSGKRNTNFKNSNGDTTLLKSVWRNWEGGSWVESVDPSIVDLSSTVQTQEVQRCLQIGLLCVQEHAEDRPTMGSVVAMLGSNIVEIPLPKPSGYCFQYIRKNSSSATTNQPNDESWSSANDITVSIIEPRNGNDLLEEIKLMQPGRI